MITPITQVPDVLLHTVATTATHTTPPVNLFERLMGEVNGVNDRLLVAEQSVQQLAAGEAVNVHQVMITLEQARLAFDLLLQVRNKALDAYQELMRMQV